jgi:hypothetical protein
VGKIAAPRLWPVASQVLAILPTLRDYASGTGLMSGATFGRLAGRSAAGFAKA